MTENMKNFLKKVSEDKAMAEKISKLEKEELIAAAKELGFELTDADFAHQEEALSDQELTTVTGGEKCLCVLAGGGTKVILTRKGITESLLLDADGVYQEYGFTPAQVPDMKGLMGDSSDNIPGIAGIGEKTALKLITQYGTLDEVLAHADEVKGKLGEKLRAGKEVAAYEKENLRMRTVRGRRGNGT